MILGHVTSLARKVLFGTRVYLLRKQGHHTDIENLCEGLLKRNPQSYLVHRHLVRALKDQGKIDEAVQIYKKILTLPGSTFFMDHLDLLTVLYEATRFNEVLQVGEQALELLSLKGHAIEAPLKDFYLDSIHRLMGGSHAELGNYREAIPHLKLACKLDKAERTEKVEELLRLCYARTEPRSLDQPDEKIE